MTAARARVVSWGASSGRPLNGGRRFAPLGQVGLGVDKGRLPGAGPGPGPDSVGLRVPNVAKGVDRDQGADDQAVLAPDRPRAQAAFHGLIQPGQFAHRGPATGPDRALRAGLGRGDQAGSPGHVRIGSPIEPADLQVEQGGRGDDGHPGDPDVKTDPLLLQPGHRPGGGVQAKGRAAGEDHGVDLVDHVAGAQAAELAGSRWPPRPEKPRRPPLPGRRPRSTR